MMQTTEGKRDRRNHCRADPPRQRGKRPISVILEADDYRALYELTMQRGVSMADTLRQIIREAQA